MFCVEGSAAGSFEIQINAFYSLLCLGEQKCRPHFAQAFSARVSGNFNLLSADRVAAAAAAAAEGERSFATTPPGEEFAEFDA